MGGGRRYTSVHVQYWAAVVHVLTIIQIQQSWNFWTLTNYAYTWFNNNYVVCREYIKLKHQVKHLRSAKTCTKATIYHSRPLKGNETLPSQCRRLSWDEINGDKGVQLGKGVFGTRYAVDIGCQKVCLKKFHSGSKFKAFIYSEVRILSLLCHFNLPWLHGVCDEPDHSIILTSLHLYNGSDCNSLTIHKALVVADSHQITPHNWKQILIGITK